MIDAVTESYRKLLSDGGLRGESCDEWTVADLEEQLGIELPASYKAFLLLAGNGCQSLEGSMYAVEDDLASYNRQAAGVWNMTELPGCVCILRPPRIHLSVLFALRRR